MHRWCHRQGCVHRSLRLVGDPPRLYRFLELGSHQGLARLLAFGLLADGRLLAAHSSTPGLLPSRHTAEWAASIGAATV